MHETGPGSARSRRRGFTLMEVIVALGLFALIAVAGFTLLDGLIGTRDRLDGRLERVAELQRAMYLLTLDFEQIADGPLQVVDGAVGFSRRSAGATGGRVPIRYSFSDGVLVREAGAVEPAPQRLISGVTAVEWSFYVVGQGWRPDWPPSVDAVNEHPRAVALTITLDAGDGGLSGPLRRVIELPDQP